MRFSIAAACLLGVLALAPVASAHDMGVGGHEHSVHAGDLEITSAWARAMLPGQKSGAAYLTIANHGAEADRLLAVSSAAAGKVEIHEMKMTGDVMVMRPVQGLDVPAGATVELKPGGYHVMFTEVGAAFAEGQAVPVTLDFARAGQVRLELPVRKGAEGDDCATH